MKRTLKITSFLAAWLFAFSLLSNCYCAPAFTSVKSKSVAHCEHHADAQGKKNADCAPRYNTDDLEKLVSQTHPTQQRFESFPLREIFPIHAKTTLSASRANFDLRPFYDSAPPIYILVRSLII